MVFAKIALAGFSRSASGMAHPFTRGITRLHNDAGQLLAESHTGGPLAGLTVTNAYDALLRRTNLALLRSGTCCELF